MAKNKSDLNEAMDSIEKTAQEANVNILQAEPENFMGTTFNQSPAFLQGGKNWIGEKNKKVYIKKDIIKKQIILFLFLYLKN